MADKTTGFLLTTNRVQGKVRRETLGGKEYLVAPTVAIVAGVLNGELVPREEIGKYVEAWNGRPVPLGHPTVRGVPVSANSPEIEANQIIGKFWNARLVDDRLHGEIWIDIEKAQALGGDALVAMQRIEAGEGIEVSTAYFRDLDAIPGQLNGLTYYGIARNLRPDHLALLLNEIGACSWKDGCGTPRTNQQRESQHTGVMVALYPPAEAAASLALSADQLPENARVIAPSELHLTLAYLGDLEEVKMDQGEVLRRVMDFAKDNPIVRGQISGIGRFTTLNEEGSQALFALFDCEYLQNWRYWLVDWLPVKRNGKGFIPHLTLAYLPADMPTPNVLPAPRELVFDRIGVAWGDQITMFPLQGTAEEAAIANKEHGFNPITYAKNAIRGLAQLIGIKAAPEESPVINQSPDGETEVLMDKSKLIDKLVANQRCPFDRTELEGMSEGALQKLERALENGGCSGQQMTPAANNVATNELTVPQEMVELRDELKAFTSAIKEMGGLESLKAAVSAVQANAAQQKADLVAELKANERCAFGEDELNAMSLEQLGKLAASLRPANYAGRGGPRGNSSASSQTPAVPEPPKVVMAEVAK